MTTERDVCKLCQNHCKLTITTFSDGSRFVTGNRCERGGDAKKKRSDRPNLYDYKYKRCFAYRRLHRQEGHSRRDRHSARPQHVRELPVLVHVCSPRSASR